MKNSSSLAGAIALSLLALASVGSNAQQAYPVVTPASSAGSGSRAMAVIDVPGAIGGVTSYVDQRIYDTNGAIEQLKSQGQKGAFATAPGQGVPLLDVDVNQPVWAINFGPGVMGPNQNASGGFTGFSRYGACIVGFGTNNFRDLVSASGGNWATLALINQFGPNARAGCPEGSGYVLMEQSEIDPQCTANPNLC